MNRKRFFILTLLAAVLCLTGCSMRTVDEMYCLPKRSDDYNDLQTVIDQAMPGLEYCAPLSGENQQTVQMADLDGDSEQEYLLFAKGGSERPLRILIFDQIEDAIVHVDTIENNGSAFDLVEYVQMDGKPGLELVVGCQLSDQLLRSVSVYSIAQSQAEKLVSANYTKFLTADMDGDSLTELFVLRPGQSDTDNGVGELYGVENGVMERTNEVSMSGPADKLKRVLTGQLHDGVTAIYAASSVDDTALITDVFAYLNGMLSNVSLSNESGTSVKTLRNYYVYADDIDNDGVVELPHLITMIPLDETRSTDRHDLIRWYAMQSDGVEVDKLYTYHNFVDGWYLEIDGSWAPRLVVLQQGNSYEFYVWDKVFQTNEKLFTIHMLTGQNREEQSLADDRFVLLKTESVIYSAELYSSAAEYNITQDGLLRSFQLIQRDWKTGET